MQGQYNYQQFPCFTQPPPKIEQSLPSVDDLTIENFLIERNHLKIKANEEKVFNYFEMNGRDRFVNVIKMNLNNLIKQQKLEEINLQNNISQISTSLWAEKINLFKSNQKKITELLTKYSAFLTELSNPNPIAAFRKTNRKSKKRRKNKRKLVKKIPAGLEEPMKTKQFEEDLQVKYEKYEIERLRSANSKRITECKRQLTLLDSLIELRSIRRKNSNASGSNEATRENYFVEQINQLKSKWNEALAKCNSQEKELKMFLTSTSSEAWLNALFSNQPEPPFGGAMNFEKLLDIRKAWDLCLVSDDNIFGSSIPLGWVLPNATPSKDWASFSG